MAGNLRASTGTSAAVASSEAVLVVVPVVVDADGAPDFGATDAATRDIAISVCPGTLVSYETTLPLGTTGHRATQRGHRGGQLPTVQPYPSAGGSSRWALHPGISALLPQR